MNFVLFRQALGAHFLSVLFTLILCQFRSFSSWACHNAPTRISRYQMRDTPWALSILANARKAVSGYMARMRVMQDGVTYHETEAFDRRPAASGWHKTHDSQRSSSLRGRCGTIRWSNRLSIRTARARTSGENLFVVLRVIDPTSDELGPPANRGGSYKEAPVTPEPQNSFHAACATRVLPAVRGYLENCSSLDRRLADAVSKPNQGIGSNFSSLSGTTLSLRTILYSVSGPSHLSQILPSSPDVSSVRSTSLILAVSAG